MKPIKKIQGKFEQYQINGTVDYKTMRVDLTRRGEGDRFKQQMRIKWGGGKQQ